MKKLFISQPMRDKTDKEILELRKQIAEGVKQFTGEDVEVIDSFLKMHHMKQNHCGFWQNRWNFFHLLTVCILGKDGRITGDAGLNTNVQCSMALILWGSDYQ